MPVFGDGFETRNLSRWTSLFGLVAQNTDQFSDPQQGHVDYAVKQLSGNHS
jgi:hypothetical protein